jgi:hypothetical protein
LRVDKEVLHTVPMCSSWGSWSKPIEDRKEANVGGHSGSRGVHDGRMPWVHAGTDRITERDSPLRMTEAHVARTAGRRPTARLLSMCILDSVRRRHVNLIELGSPRPHNLGWSRLYKTDDKAGGRVEKNGKAMATVSTVDTWLQSWFQTGNSSSRDPDSAPESSNAQGRTTSCGKMAAQVLGTVAFVVRRQRWP